MTVVVDVSLAVKWVVQEEHTADARALWLHWQGTGEPVIAPPIFKSEATNVLHQKVRRGSVDRTHAGDALDYLLSAVAIDEPSGLYRAAFTLAGDLGLGSAYDALYLALAESERCEVWTADQRLVRSARSRFPQLRWLAERP